MTQGTVLVTGATGRVGGQVATQLAEAGVPVRALTRDPSARGNTMPQGIEVVGGDLGRPEELTPVLAGIDAVFLVFPSVTGDGTAHDLLQTLARHVGRIVYLSAYGVPDRPDARAEPDGTIVGSHAHLEGLISSATVEHTFLRSSGFAANTLAWAEQISRSDVVRWFYADATRSLVHEADLAAVGVRALTEDGHAGGAYHLTGPEQLTQAEMLMAIGRALGRDLHFEEIDPDQARAELFSGAPEAMATSIIESHARMVDQPEQVTDTVRRLVGRPALTFDRWATDHVDDFGGR